MILLDTSGLLAAIDESQRFHTQCAEALRKAKAPLLLSPFVLAELDYLLVKYMGVEAEMALLDEVSRCAYQLESFGSNDIAAAKEIVSKYQDADIALTDASIVVLADRFKARDLLTLDRRHFGNVRRSDGTRFRLFPVS